MKKKNNNDSLQIFIKVIYFDESAAQDDKINESE